MKNVYSLVRFFAAGVGILEKEGLTKAYKEMNKPSLKKAFGFLEGKDLEGVRP